MKRLFTEQMAAKCLLVIFSLVVIFHVLVISGVVPFEIVWGGKLTDPKEMMYFEIGSIAINLTYASYSFGICRVFEDTYKASCHKSCPLANVCIIYFKYSG